MKKVQIHNSDAFTLIEMIVVIVIMGLLMAVGVPAYRRWTEYANDSTTRASLVS